MRDAEVKKRRPRDTPQRNACDIYIYIRQDKKNGSSYINGHTDVFFGKSWRRPQCSTGSSRGSFVSALCSKSHREHKLSIASRSPGEPPTAARYAEQCSQSWPFIIALFPRSLTTFPETRHSTRTAAGGRGEGRLQAANQSQTRQTKTSGTTHATHTTRGRRNGAPQQGILVFRRSFPPRHSPCSDTKSAQPARNQTVSRKKKEASGRPQATPHSYCSSTTGGGCRRESLTHLLELVAFCRPGLARSLPPLCRRRRRRRRRALVSAAHPHRVRINHVVISRNWSSRRRRLHFCRRRSSNRSSPAATRALGRRNSVGVGRRRRDGPSTPLPACAAAVRAVPGGRVLSFLDRVAFRPGPSLRVTAAGVLVCGAVVGTLPSLFVPPAPRIRGGGSRRCWVAHPSA